MTCYLAYGEVVSTALDLPELALSPAPAGATPTITIGPVAIGSLPAREWTDTVVEGGKTVARGAIEDGVLQLRFFEAVQCACELRTGAIRVWAVEGVEAAVVRHLVLDQTVPRLLVARGEVVLHAGAVVIGGSAIAFCGASGAGKSMLSARLTVAGAQLLADDALRIRTVAGSIVAEPAYPGVRLHELSDVHLPIDFDGSAGTLAPKSRAGRSQLEFAAGPSPLGAVVDLRRGADELSIERLRGAHAFQVLYHASIDPLFNWVAIDAATFDRVAGLASVAILALHLPDDSDPADVLAALSTFAA